MSKLIIIRGNSASGKTTTARALQQKLGQNTMVISQDMVRREILRVKDGFDTLARELFGDQIYAWYFDLSFEETLRRHAGSDKAKEFGETEMRRWWIEKDFLPEIPEKFFSAELRQDQILTRILDDIGL